MKRLLLALLFAACSSDDSGDPPSQGETEKSSAGTEGIGEALDGETLTANGKTEQTQPSTPNQDSPKPSAVLPWPKLQPSDAWKLVLVELQAGASMPKVPTEFAGQEQRASIDRARLLTERLSLAPKDRKLLLQLANAYARSLFPERALAVLGLRLSNAPSDSVALKLSAVVLAAKGRHQAALALFEYLTDLAPKDTSLAGPMHMSYWESGALDAGRAVLEKGLELQPFHPVLKLRLGAVLFEFEEYEDALVLLQEATDSRPNDTEAWFRLASCLNELERPEEAHVATTIHDRLIQMEEFGIPDSLKTGPRRLALVRALVASDDLVGARRELDALAADGLPISAPDAPDEFAEIPN